MTWVLHHGDCRDVLATLPDCSVDSVVTDPPYGLSCERDAHEVLRHWLAGDDYEHRGGGFMGKSWDSFVPGPSMWREVYRVLKPGGHMAVFGGTRTYDLLTLAIRLAGFEIRDSLHWVYGSGFPKSLDVSKAIDKAAGAEREVIGHSKGVAVSPDDNQYGGINRGAVGIKQVGVDVPITAPATDAAKQWEGWGTALKPAHEPIVLARKPLIGTVAANVLELGTGALNIDGARVEASDAFGGGAKATSGFVNGYEYDGWVPGNPAGRWPANVIFDTEAGAVLDEQSGVSKGNARTGPPGDTTFGGGKMNAKVGQWFGDSGGASRFFTSIDWNPEIDVPFRYVAKPSKRERNSGLDGLPEVVGKRTQDGGDDTRGRPLPINQNHHPTVKPLALMRWLVRLITPPGGTVLEPFAGSGTTLMAAVMEGFDCIGIEMTDEYLPIIQGRVAWAENQPQPEPQPTQETLPL